MPTYDFDQIPDNDYPLLPAADYRCRVMTIDDSMSTKNGDLQWQVEFMVIDGSFKGLKIFDRVIHSAKTVNRIKKIAKCFIDVSGTASFEKTDMIGKEVVLTTIVDIYNQQEHTKVSFAGYTPVDTEDPF